MQNVLITGGAKRIGRGLGIEFAKLGWNVIFIYNESEGMAQKTLGELKQFSPNAMSFQCDLRDSAQIENTFSLIYSNLKKIDLLINNAGVFPKARKLEEIDNHLWDDTMDVNLKASYLTSKELAKRETDSRIVNIVSLGAFEIWKNRIPYNVSKSGLMKLSEALARELAPRIAVNSISPGTIFFPDEEPVEPGMSDVNKIPMGRLGNIEDVFSAVHFFATCSKYITGQNLNIDGGYHLVK